MKATRTAREAHLLNCHVCDKLCSAGNTPAGSIAVCPRCGATMHLRKQDSIARTWAFLITSIILYIPANVYPIMTVTILGKGEPDTIGSGVVALLDGGMWPLALIVFIASIFVPLLKMLGLTVLLLSVKYKWRWRPIQRTVMYRIIELIGRWSMVDVFMISILVAVVAFGHLAEVYAGVGARAFALVVVFTIFAAKSFDPRLIWDSLGDDRKKG